MSLSLVLVMAASVTAANLNFSQFEGFRRWRVVRKGRFRFADFGPAAFQYRHHCVGDIQRVPRAVIREDDYLFDVRDVQSSLRSAPAFDTSRHRWRPFCRIEIRPF